MRANHGIDVIIPSSQQRRFVHNVIYQELISGIVSQKSRLGFQKVIQDLKWAGAQGVVLSCTEIPLLIKPEHSELPVFDTTALHAAKAVELALELN